MLFAVSTGIDFVRIATYLFSLKMTHPQSYFLDWGQSLQVDEDKRQSGTCKVPSKFFSDFMSANQCAD